MTHLAWQQITIGNAHILVDDEDFVQGYHDGYETCHTYHHHEEMIDTSTFLFLLRNGWDTGRSEQWNTGYILGWLAAFYEQEKGTLALCVDVGEKQRAYEPAEHIQRAS